MAHWHDVAVTSDGVAMLNEMMAGKKLCLTSAYGGTGVVGTESLGEQTAMVNQKQKLALVDEQDGPDGKTVTVQITSVGNSAEYLLRQIGVYAKLDMDGAEEKLLFLMQDTGVSIPAETEENFLLEIYCTLRIGADAQLTVTIDPSGIVTLQRMQNTIDKYRTLCDEGNPTTATVGTVGQHYINTLTKKEFVCVAVGEQEYTWQVAGANIAGDLTCGGRPLEEILGGMEQKSGAAAPTESTVGAVGQKYTDTSTGNIYTCIAISLGDDGDTHYKWVPGSLGTLEEIRIALNKAKVDLSEIQEDLSDVSAALSNKADKGPPTWYDLPLNTAKFSFGFARYCKDQFGIVHVSISCPTINRGTVPDGTLIGTLPDGFRPTIDVHCVYYDTNTPRLVRTSFMKNGTIVGYGCDGNGFSNVNLEMSFAFFV